MVVLVMLLRKHFILKLFFFWRIAEGKKYECTTNPVEVPVMAAPWVRVPRQQFILKFILWWKTVAEGRKYKYTTNPVVVEVMAEP